MSFSTRGAYCSVPKQKEVLTDRHAFLVRGVAMNRNAPSAANGALSSMQKQTQKRLKSGFKIIS